MKLLVLNWNWLLVLCVVSAIVFAEEPLGIGNKRVGPKMNRLNDTFRVAPNATEIRSKRFPKAERALIAPYREQGVASVAASEVGAPWISMEDGYDVTEEFYGPSDLLTKMGHTVVPTTMLCADFDEDGMDDLVCGFWEADSGVSKTDQGGISSIHFGNPHGTHPDSPSARKNKAKGTFNSNAFLPHAVVFDVPIVPEFMGAGDFNGDTHEDLVVGVSGKDAMFLLFGDGRGGFSHPEPLSLNGTLTALTVGEVNVRDGDLDLVVATTNETVSQVEVFQNRFGILGKRPHIILLDAPVKQLECGRLDGDLFYDVAAMCDGKVEFLFGVNHRLRDKTAALGDRKSAWISEHGRLEAIALGRFTSYGRTNGEVAVLCETGDIFYVDTTKREVVEVHRLDDISDGPFRLVKTKISSIPVDDLIVLDQTYRQVHVVVARNKNWEGPGNSQIVAEPWSVELPVTSQPVDVVPMRLNRDALFDLVILKHEAAPLAVALTQPANTWIVDSQAIEGNCEDPQEPCTLKAAVQACGSYPGSDEILFDIDGGGPKTLSAGSFWLEDTVTIDATTQNCALENCIMMTSQDPQIPDSGFLLRGSSNTIRGMSFDNVLDPIFLDPESNDSIIAGNFVGTDLTGTFPATGGTVSILSSGNIIGGTTHDDINVFANAPMDSLWVGHWNPELFPIWNEFYMNHIGTDITGSWSFGNSRGIALAGSDHTIGKPRAGNVISSSFDFDGINIANGSENVLVESNVIGTDFFGMTARGNNECGIVTYGLLTTIRDNLVSGNGKGICMMGATEDTTHQVINNRVGTDFSGFSALGNQGFGIGIMGCQNNLVQGNLVSGNGRGIEISWPGTDDNDIRSNLVGVDFLGTTALPNHGHGILIDSGSNNRIGGFSREDENVISGNQGNGIRIQSTHAPASQNEVFGNCIGLDRPRQEAVPNFLAGVVIHDATENYIGGLTSSFGMAPGNLISGNLSHGVYIFGPEARDNVVEGNAIGVNVLNVQQPNGESGVYMMQGAHDNTVERNRIAFNWHCGVDLLGGAEPAGLRNEVTENSISHNNTLGIDLLADGTVLPNDPGDGDTGPNNLQNFPVLTDAVATSTTTTVEGTLNSRPNKNYTIEFFANANCDVSEYGEGDWFFGSIVVPTDANGDAVFSYIHSDTLGGYYVSATACDSDTVNGDGTSEFSECILVTGDPAISMDLALTKTCDPTTVSMGAAVACTLIVDNQGMAAATNVTLIDFLPGGITFVSATPSQGFCSYDSVSHTVTCNLGVINPLVQADVLIQSQADAYGELQNIAYVDGDQIETNTDNNIAQAVVTVLCLDFAAPSGVGIEDLLDQQLRWRLTSVDPGYESMYDRNDDNIIDMLDFVAVVNHFGDDCL